VTNRLRNKTSRAHFVQDFVSDLKKKATLKFILNMKFLLIE
jgi:hypothetical protein